MGRDPILSIVMPYGGRADLQAACAALVGIDLHQMQANRIPPLYQSKVRYRSIHGAARCRSDMRESCERILSALQLIREGFGDCKDLACYRIAELLLAGKLAKPLITATDIGWHVRVQHPDGSIEDPSRALGMKG